MNIKEEIDNLIYSTKDEYAEIRLKYWLKTFETWGGKWRLENLRFHETEMLLAFGAEEWRN